MYGFVMTLPEYTETIPTLWRETRNFIQEHPEYLAENNGWKFLTTDEGRTYTNCHFVSWTFLKRREEEIELTRGIQWSNFEIASLDTWRKGGYPEYFDFLDSKGGFFYERWGDAPVHSLAAALFLRMDQIHFFNDIGKKRWRGTRGKGSKG